MLHLPAFSDYSMTILPSFPMEIKLYHLSALEVVPYLVSPRPVGTDFLRLKGTDLLHSPLPLFERNMSL
jgi:hypothetical protein